MKNIITLLSLFITLTSYAQEVYRFSPKWNVGDVKQLHIEEKTQEFENGVSVEESLTTNEASIEVLSESKEAYTINVLFENQVWKAVEEMSETFGNKSDQIEDISLIFTIDKKTAELDLQNWEELQGQLNNSFDMINSIISEENEEMAGFMEIVFAPIREMFNSEENVKEYMNSMTGSIFIPYGQDFELNSPIAVTESAENPFNPGTELSATTIMTLVSVDKKENTCEIKHEMEMDMTEFIEMIKGMMMSMGEAAGADEESIAAKEKEFEEFSMDMTYTEIIDFDMGTTWVSKTVATTLIEGFDPMKQTKNKAVVTRTLSID